MQKRLITGARPTGRLHLGHYVGMFMDNLGLQDTHEYFFLIADMQVFTDHLPDSGKTESNIREMILDLLALGLKPENTIYVQSRIPELYQLTVLISMFAKMSELERNPTIKSEKDAYEVKSPSLGFMSYPVSQVADIVGVKASVVPVGKDQLPHIELARNLVKRINTFAQEEILKMPSALLSTIPNLVGIDGDRKMSKSLNNQIDICSDSETLQSKVNKMITDKNKVRRFDPGDPSSCKSVFIYQSVFNPSEANNISLGCASGELGCGQCKKSLFSQLEKITKDFRERRKLFENSDGLVEDILQTGTKKVRAETQEVLSKLKEALGINYRGY